jgi:hypothetical protein
VLGWGGAFADTHTPRSPKAGREPEGLTSPVLCADKQGVCVTCGEGKRKEARAGEQETCWQDDRGDLFSEVTGIMYMPELGPFRTQGFGLNSLDFELVACG